VRWVADRDASRLHGFSALAHQVDDQKAILKAGALDLDVVGERELAPKRPCGDPAMQEELFSFSVLRPSHTVRRPSQIAGTPRASRLPRWRRQKNLEGQEKFQGVGEIFSCKDSGRLTLSIRARPRRPCLARGSAASRAPFPCPPGIFGLQFFLNPRDEEHEGTSTCRTPLSRIDVSRRRTTMETEMRETGTLIGSDKVEGTAVYGADDQKIGSIERVMIDKVSGQVSYAVLGFGGFLGIGDDHYPLPWQSLKYDTNLGGYRTNLTADRLQGAPKYGNDNDWSWDDPGRARAINDYYSGF
jgi:PRC-barrel domain